MNELAQAIVDYIEARAVERDSPFGEGRNHDDLVSQREFAERELHRVCDALASEGTKP